MTRRRVVSTGPPPDALRSSETCAGGERRGPVSWLPSQSTISCSSRRTSEAPTQRASSGSMPLAASDGGHEAFGSPSRSATGSIICLWRALVASGVRRAGTSATRRLVDARSSGPSSRYRQPAAAGLSGDDRALTVPAAAKALTCARNRVNSNRSLPPPGPGSLARRKDVRHSSEGPPCPPTSATPVAPPVSCPSPWLSSVRNSIELVEPESPTFATGCYGTVLTNNGRCSPPQSGRTARSRRAMFPRAPSQKPADHVLEILAASNDLYRLGEVTRRGFQPHPGRLARHTPRLLHCTCTTSRLSLWKNRVRLDSLRERHADRAEPQGIRLQQWGRSESSLGGWHRRALADSRSPRSDAVSRRTMARRLGRYPR